MNWDTPRYPHCPAGAHAALLFWDLTSSSSSQDEKFRKVSKRWGNKEKFLSAASSERRVALRLQKKQECEKPRLGGHWSVGTVLKA